ncbi:MAG: hypothetical protein CMC08_00050 [Flavobacteriaceae bacterium]|nr:hypothetical protein [Flavobacteriaceae bacterium]
MPSNLQNEPRTKSRLPLYLSLGLLGCLVGGYFIFPTFQQSVQDAWQILTSGDPRQIRDWVEGFGWLGPLVVNIAMVVQMFLIVVPTIALMVVSILAYGPIWGSLLVFVAVYLASSVGYVIGHYFGEDLVDSLLGPKTTGKIESFIEDYGFWAVVITRINPFLSNDAISFVAGILGMGYWRFMAATMAGIFPLVFFIAVLGQSTDSLKSGLLWGSLISLVIFGGYIYWDKKKNK